MRLFSAWDTRIGLWNAGNLAQGFSRRSMITEGLIRECGRVSDQVDGAAADQKTEADADCYGPRTAIESQERYQGDYGTKHSDDVVGANGKEPAQGKEGKVYGEPN